MLRGKVMRGIGWLLLLAIVAGTAMRPAPAAAQATPWVASESARARLVATTSGVGAGESVTLGLHIRLAKGWKTYWRVPGDSGVPPRLDWRGSGNVAAAQPAWPAPTRYSAFGFDTFGYADEVVFPITVTLTRPGTTAQLRLSVDYAACERICVLEEAQFVLDIPAGDALPTPHAALVERYAMRVPKSGEVAPFVVESLVVDRGAEPTLLITAQSAGAPFVAPDLFVEGPAGLTFGAPEIEFNEAGHIAQFALPIRPAGEGASLEGETLTLTLVDGGRSAEQVLTAGPGS